VNETIKTAPKTIYLYKFCPNFYDYLKIPLLYWYAWMKWENEKREIGKREYEKREISEK
jgi:hypothetical protein